MKEDIIKIISLGGFNQVTQNMFVYHFLPQGKEEGSQILVVDVGVGFPERDLLGVDLIIPDFSYLLKRKDKVVGVVLTHGHEDHIGALPLFLSQFKRDVPLWGAKLTAGFAEEKLAEFGIDKRLNIFSEEDRLSLGVFQVEPIRVTHSIPDTYHLLIRTPIGNFYHGTDFKFDFTPLDQKPARLDKISRAGKERIIALLSDCLGSEHSGYSPSEMELGEMFEEQIKRAKGRVFVTAISSNIYRWQQAISASVKFGRRIALVGMSVEKSVKLARRLGYLNLREKDMIKPERIKNFPDHQVTVLVGGSLGQPGSSLDKIVVGKHRLKIKPTDKVIFSSPDYVPGTTGAIYHQIDTLAKKGVEVVYGEIEGPLHVSGHGYQQEIALLIQLVSPQWLIPIGGNYRHMQQFRFLAQRMGIDSKRVIIPEENQALVFSSHGLIRKKFLIPRRRVLVDGLGVGDVGQTVLRDRRTLAQNGMIVVIILMDSSSGKMVGKPTVVSRGFVYLKENKELIKWLEERVVKIFFEVQRRTTGMTELKREIQGRLEEIISQETGREPMILPVIIEI